jgi:hypothetical protein
MIIICYITTIGEYYSELLLVILCYIMTIGDYFILNYCWIFYVMLSHAFGNYSIINYFKLLYLG